ncbi:Polyketide cyclase / dehydrase and lipid transport [Aliiroseovarius sediminilitoris]|uniref:Polyketide cyclase / dehydrase and lipid transport n=1 Tax=Aliiroseovarius sediminilitoris TaxID=1173584 RepID=A0A1I0PTN2_9RHOB|nr:SRPBCC family protein [Aliiroseovarius sediminilitoris]SEW17706.1 Polyketide cyclase / dehydrase and lipid transport [Aliiroseovarius sediminilitoris]
MNPILITSLAVLVQATATVGWAEQYTVERSLQVSSPKDTVWNQVGDFCDIDDWHPAVSDCSLKVIDGSLHRVLTLTDGGEFVEKRIAVEPGLSYTYRIVSSPLPLEKYTATFSITHGDSTTITWAGRFSADDPETEKTIAGIYEAGLSAIEERLAD